MKIIKNTKKTKNICFVIPTLNIKEKVSSLYTKISDAIEKLGHSCEIIFIDTGSTDGTWDQIMQLKNEFPYQVQAYRSGMNMRLGGSISYLYGQSNCDVFFTVDSSLENGIEKISQFIEKLDSGYDIVSVDNDEAARPNYRSKAEKKYYQSGFVAYSKSKVNRMPLQKDMIGLSHSGAEKEGYKLGEIELEKVKSLTLVNSRLSPDRVRALTAAYKAS